MSLTLSRLLNESIHIGPDVRVAVVAIRDRGTRVQLKIDTPQDTKVIRATFLDGVSIGPMVSITIVAIKDRGNRVQLKIDAPRTVRILREELADAATFTPMAGRSTLTWLTYRPET